MRRSPFYATVQARRADRSATQLGFAVLVLRSAMVEFVDTIARSNRGEITMEEITVSHHSTLPAIGRRDQLSELLRLCGVEAG